MFKNGLINIKAAGYNGARTVFRSKIMKKKAKGKSKLNDT